MTTDTTERADSVARLVRESVHRVDAIAPDAMRALAPFLKRARDELQGELAEILGKADPDERFTAYQRTLALRSLESTFERIEELDPAMAKALGIGRNATGAIAVSTLDEEVRRLSAIFGDGVPHIPQLAHAAIIAKGDALLWKRHTTSAARYAGALGDDLRAQLAIGLAKGETFAQLAQRMRKLDPATRGAMGWDPQGMSAAISDGMFHRWRHWADRVIRTENMHAYNTQHDLAIQALDDEREEDEEPWLRRWDASADKVTCERCKALDRTVTTVDGVFKWGYKCPPAHPYCRCTVLAWRASWGDMRGEVPTKGADGGDVAPKPHVPPPPKPKPAPPPPEPKAPAAAKGLPQASKPATVAPVTPQPAPAPIKPAKVKPEPPLKVQETQPGHWFAEKGKDYASGKSREHALENLERRIAERTAEDAKRKERKEREEREKAERKAQRAAGIKPSEAPLPAGAAPNMIPPGAQIKSLRRHGLVERTPEGWRLNARGMAHFAAKRDKAIARKQNAGEGTCQICEGKWAMVRGKVSLHGYTRPGYGFITGSCRGSQQLAWEESCNVVGKWISELSKMLEHAEGLLARFDERDTFNVDEPIAADDTKAHRPAGAQLAGGRWYYKGQVITKSVAITSEDARYEQAKARALTELENRIDRLRQEITRQTARLETWAPNKEWIAAARAAGDKDAGSRGGPAAIAPVTMTPIAMPTPPARQAQPAAPPHEEPKAAEPELPPVWEKKKNPKRQEAARKAAAASVERRREIHGAVASNLPQELQVAWNKEGHKFMQENAHRTKGIEDPINAASKISEAFAETYGSGAETIRGNEGDRYFKRAEIEAKHAEDWADEQEAKYYKAAQAEAYRNGEIDDQGRPTKKGKARDEELDDWGLPKKVDDDDPPF